MPPQALGLPTMGSGLVAPEDGGSHSGRLEALHGRVLKLLLAGLWVHVPAATCLAQILLSGEGLRPKGVPRRSAWHLGQRRW